jgi:putative ABC transport system permease protein
MTLKLVWKNMVFKPLNTALCLCLLIFGVSIISILIVVQNQLKETFEKNLQNFDVVVGAKGSPLQLVLSAIYHLDAPTGNIYFSGAKKLMENPMVKVAIPLSYGDYYKNYRILGTTIEYLKIYNATLETGEFFSKSMEVTIGANVAKTTNAKLGDFITGNHGNIYGHSHDDKKYQIIGILKPQNTVLDNLILTKLESVWQVHENHDDEELHKENSEEHEKLEITAILIKYKSKIASLNIPKFINQQTNMQAVLPALEINRLFYFLGVGISTIKMIAFCIIFLAGFSVFFVLFSRLKDRKYEIALLRTLGYQPKDIFLLLVLEGIILSIIGYVFGWFFSRIGLYFINNQTTNDFNMSFLGHWIPEEIGLLFSTLLVGIISSILAAWKAMKIEVSKTLSSK